MKKIIVVALLIILIAAALLIIRLSRKQEIEKWPSGQSFPRKPALEDELPSLSLGQKSEMENWWYHATLNGNDSKTYVLRVTFSRGAGGDGGSLLFGEFRKEGLPLRGFSGMEVQTTSNNITLKCSQIYGYSQTTITPPDDSRVTIEVYGEYRLDLNFESRGLPYWYGNGFGALIDGWIVNGHEDFSTVGGILQYDEKIINLTGQGLFERARWDDPVALTSTNWYPVHFDQGYTLVFRARGEHGSIYKDAAVSIAGIYDYVNEPDKIKVFIEKEDQAPEKNHVIVETKYGKLEIFGILRGRVEEKGIHLIYNYTGSFTYNNGTVLTLTGGNGWEEYRPW